MLKIQQGGTFTAQFTWADEAGAAIDLTGFDACLNIRPTEGSATIIHKATTANGGLVISGTTLTLAIEPVVTALFAFSKAVADVRLEKDGVVTFWPKIEVVLEGVVSRECS